MMCPRFGDRTFAFAMGGLCWLIGILVLMQGIRDLLDYNTNKKDPPKRTAIWRGVPQKGNPLSLSRSPAAHWAATGFPAYFAQKQRKGDAPEKGVPLP